MAAIAEDSFRRAMRALKAQDAALAQRVCDGDEAVDRMESDIERDCVQLIALQQPIAGDLRLVTAVLKMITDIERIADQSADICEIMLPVLGNLQIEIPDQVFDMGEFIASMVHDAVHAYLQQDEPQAQAVIDSDETVDRWFDETTALIQRQLEQKGDAAQLIKLAYVAKYLERVADHATNVAEWAVYRIRGIR